MIRIIVLQPGRSVRGWIQFKEDYVGLPRTGTFTVRATYVGGYLETAADDYVRCTFSSNDVTFTVEEPKGADAEIVALIDKRMTKQFPPKPPPLRPSPEEVAIWQQEEANREARRDTWYNFAHELRDEIRKQSKSPRFAAVASFYHGMVSLENPEEAPRYLKECEDSPASSRYLRGLAAYYFLECKSRDNSVESENVSKNLAERLIATHPRTAVAQDAQEILERLQLPRD